MGSRNGNTLFDRIRIHAEDFLYLVEDFSWIFVLGPLENVLAFDAEDPAEAARSGSDSSASPVGNPIVAVHGFGQAPYVFHKMRRYLRARGRRLHLFNYYFPQSVKRSARRLERYIEQVLEETGAEKVDLIGHSLGGLVVRYCAQALEAGRRIATCVTLGAPHQGTRISLYVPAIRSLTEMNRIFRPSRFCRELNQLPKPEGVRFVNFYSPLDFFVQSKDRGSWPEADKNICVDFVGHLGMIMDYRFFDILHRELRTVETMGKVIQMPERA